LQSFVQPYNDSTRQRPVTYEETKEMDLMAGERIRAALPKRRSKIMIVDDDAARRWAYICEPIATRP